MEVFVPLKGVIDIEEERARLIKNLKKVQKDLSAVNRKLANESFMAKAPKEVVEKEQKKMDDMLIKEKKIEEGLEALSS
jgi:valyl-tRNA synthetase